VATPPEAPPAGTSSFEVHLENFSGPFDLLLGLISKRKLDITEVALAEVTDEFIGYLRAADAAGGKRWDLGQASEFLVIAATLLDLKAARLLPAGDVEDAEDQRSDHEDLVGLRHAGTFRGGVVRRSASLSVCRAS